jgi:Glycosyl transferase family 2
MLPAPLRRIRSVLGARLHLLQAQYEAAARAAELRPSIDRLEAAVEEWRTTESEQLLAQRQETAELRAAITALREIQTKQLRLSRAEYDDIGGLREKLIALRRSDTYAATFENRHPLVSVPIATFNAAELLVDRAIASVRAQTYDRWEIVVVGDASRAWAILASDSSTSRLGRRSSPPAGMSAGRSQVWRRGIGR